MQEHLKVETSLERHPRFVFHFTPTTNATASAVASGLISML